MRGKEKKDNEKDSKTERWRYIMVGRERKKDNEKNRKIEREINRYIDRERV